MELRETEGLGQVVVGAGIESRHPILLAATRGDDDDRRVGFAPDAPDHGLAVEVGQSQVEQDQVRAAAVP